MLKSGIILAAVSLPLLALLLGSTDEPVKTVEQEPASYDEARAIAGKTAGFKNLQHIGLALHGYHDVFGHFPAAVCYGPDGKTPYSWRVELLPVLKHYVDGIDAGKLNGKLSRAEYDELIAACGYDISQPWDSEKNRSVLAAIPQVYRHPGDKPDSTATSFYAVAGSGTAFDPDDTAKFTDIKGWAATTLMVVESRSKEPWTKPIDIAYSQSATVPRLGGFTDNGFLALTCDGAVHFISDAVSPDNLRAFISKDTTDEFSIMGVPYRY